MHAKLLWSLAVFIMLPGVVQAAPKIEHWVTENGARAYFIETHALPMIDINLVFDAASAREPAGLQGLATITSDMTHALRTRCMGGVYTKEDGKPTGGGGIRLIQQP